MSDGFAGIPRTVLRSASYRDLSPIARCVLIELVCEMNGYNNGQIAVAQRELRERVGCSPRQIVNAFAELFEHGFVHKEVEGTWKTRLARQYRLTFVSTKSDRATNDYAHWTPTIAKSGATTAVAEGGLTATTAVAEGRKLDTAAVARIEASRRKTAISAIPSATTAVALIYKPYQGGDAPVTDRPKAPLQSLPTSAGPRCVHETDDCEGCGSSVDRTGARGKPKRFCSEACRLKAERARAYARRRAASAPVHMNGAAR